MGGGGGQPGKQQAEIPHNFYIGVYPVTQEQWEAVMGSNPSFFSRSGDGMNKVKSVSDADLKQFPVENVSWENAKEFIDKLNARETDSSEWVYRLPTEAEWEYACRGGATSKTDCSFDFYLEQPTNDLSSSQANFDGNHPAGRAPKGRYLERTSKVGSYKPNRLGICDMHGNVWEWCEDSWEGGSDRVIRGGSWLYRGSDCRAADRRRFAPLSGNDLLGFRLARVPSSQ
jgi:formylglycine-generating enzyme required for sulfatase activity